MLKELAGLKERYDLIILDLPSGIDIGLRRLMLAADDPVVVTTGEPTALTDAYALMKALRSQQPDLVPRVVVNIADSQQAGQRIFEGLSRVCDRFLGMTPLSLGAVRRDRRVMEAISRQTPLFQCHPNCDAALDAMAVARSLSGNMGIR
jgi:flagellar biosynthesis protein FlhG